MADQVIWDDLMAASYRGLKIPFGRSICDYTLLQYMQQVKDKSILDIGSGEGRFCRQLKANGASRVVGVDISPVMLKSAKEANSLSGECEYLLGDARNLPFIDQFDFVTSTGLLPYAETVDDLKAMCRTFYSNLKPGGRFLAIGVNCKSDGQLGNSMRPYGVESYTPLPPINEAKRIKYVGRKFDENCPQFTATLFYYEPDVFDNAFKEVGFKSFKLVPTLIDPESEKEYPDGYWELYRVKPSHLCYVAEK